MRKDYERSHYVCANDVYITEKLLSNIECLTSHFRLFIVYLKWHELCILPFMRSYCMHTAHCYTHILYVYTSILCRFFYYLESVFCWLHLKSMKVDLYCCVLNAANERMSERTNEKWTSIWNDCSIDFNRVVLFFCEKHFEKCIA